MLCKPWGEPDLGQTPQAPAQKETRITPRLPVSEITGELLPMVTVLIGNSESLTITTLRTGHHAHLGLRHVRLKTNPPGPGESCERGLGTLAGEHLFLGEIPEEAAPTERAKKYRIPCSAETTSEVNRTRPADTWCL